MAAPGRRPCRPTPTCAAGWSTSSGCPRRSATSWPGTPSSGRCSRTRRPSPSRRRRGRCAHDLLRRRRGATRSSPEPVASARRGGARPPAHRLPPSAARDRRPRPERAGHDGHGRALAVRPRRLRPRGGPGRRARGGRRRRRPVPLRRHRDGQVRRPRAELRQRRRRHLRRRAGRRGRRGARAGGRDVARHRPHARLHGSDARGHHLGGRRGAAARGQAGRAGPHDRVARRLLRALGEDLGVPGAAQGAAGRGRPRARARVRRRRQPVRVERRRPSRASSRTCRRCVAASSSTCRRGSPSAS